MNHTQFSTLGLVTTLVLLGMPAGALADVNSYVTDAGGFWDAAGHWSLGHCPLQGEDIEIRVSGTAHKAVDYNWSGVSDYKTITVDGSGSFYGAIWHLDHVLWADRLNLGDNGEAWHWMEGDSFLWLTDMLVVGWFDPGPGHFYLNNTANGVLVNGNTWVGSQGPGDFDHRNGSHATERLLVGGTGGGTYSLSGPESTSQLSASEYAHVGETGLGIFDQSGGTVTCEWFGLMVGYWTGGVGYYNLSSGVLDSTNIRIGWRGDGYFTQSGGTVSISETLEIGPYESQPNRAWYELNEDDNPATLTVGTDMKIGEVGLARYTQSAGTATVTNDLHIWQGTTGTVNKSYVQLYGGLLDVQGSVQNHGGAVFQSGGVLTTPSFTSDSSFRVSLDQTADFRATSLDLNDGLLILYDSATLRGELAIPPATYFLSDFVNSGTFQMGSTARDGGTFVGNLINNGTFQYYAGDFSASTVTNQGTLSLLAPFTCHRFVHNAYAMPVTSTAPITAAGTGHPIAFESNGNLTIQPDAHITVLDAPLVSNAPLYAPGTVYGDVVNNDYLLPSMTSAPEEFYIDGDFTQSSTGTLRVRLGGTQPISEFDRVRLTGHATLGGQLDVRLINDFTPSLGDSFRIMVYNGGHTGEYTTESLPALPPGLAWDVRYLSAVVQLDVVEGINCPGDLNGDTQVGLSDLAQLLASYGTSNGAVYEDGDIDLDGDVDLSDLAFLLSVFGTTCS